MITPRIPFVGVLTLGTVTTLKPVDAWSDTGINKVVEDHFSLTMLVRGGWWMLLLFVVVLRCAENEASAVERFCKRRWHLLWFRLWRSLVRSFSETASIFSVSLDYTNILSNDVVDIRLKVDVYATKAM